MTHLESSQFGDIVFDPDQIIEFPAGLPAFEGLRSFLLLAIKGSAIGALQSVDQPSVCFPVMPIASLVPAYQMDLTAEDRECLLAPSEASADLLTLAILTLPESGLPTANLLAPVVIHTRTRRGVQSVRGDLLYSPEYSLAGPRQHDVERPSCS